MGKALSRLAAISPLGPIFDRELRSISRRKRTYALRFFYLAALLLIMFSTFMSMRTSYGGAAQRAQRLAEQGTVFFTGFAIFTWFAMALVGPILTCTAISSERLHKTLPVLLMTPITTWQIVGGKLFSRLLIALMLIGLSLPVLAVVRLLGGVEIEQVVGALSICISTVLLTASLGLLLSTLINRAYSTILTSYAFLAIVWMVAPLICGMFLFAVLELRSPAVYSVCQNLMVLSNPFYALITLIERQGLGISQLSWYWSVLSQLGMALVLLIFTGLLLRYTTRRQEARGGVTVEPPRLPLLQSPAIATGQAGPAGQGETQPPAKPIGSLVSHRADAQPSASKAILDNPVLWRELRRPVMATRRQSVVALVLTVGILLLIYLVTSLSVSHTSRSPLSYPESQMVFAVCFCGMMTLLCCVLAATAIAQEKESDTWTLLLTTPMTAGQIVRGKILGLAYRMVWPMGIVTGHFLLFTFCGAISWVSFLMILWLITTTNFIWLATGVYYSLRCKTVTMAVILNMLGPVVIYLVALMVLGIIGEAVNNNGGSYAELVGLYAPYTYLITGMEYLDRHRSGWPGEVWLPVFGRVPWQTFFLAVAGVGVGYLVASALAIWHTIGRFDAMVHRAKDGKARN